jgi:hypothetical protein
MHEEIISSMCFVSEKISTLKTGYTNIMMTLISSRMVGPALEQEKFTYPTRRTNSDQTAGYINALVTNPITSAPHQTLLSLEPEDFNSSVAYIAVTLPALPQSGKYTVVSSLVRTTIPAVMLA